MAHLSRVIGLSVAIAASAGSFYSPGHWNYVKRLNSRNADSEIKQAVDAGKTMFVRWIHSTG